MNSIAEIFQDGKQLLDGITNFVNKYIGCTLLRKCGITKVVDTVAEKGLCEYTGLSKLEINFHMQY